MTLRARIGNAVFSLSFVSFFLSFACAITLSWSFIFYVLRVDVTWTSAFVYVRSAKVILSCDDSFSMNHLILCDLMTSSLVFVVDLIHSYACKWKKSLNIVEWTKQNLINFFNIELLRVHISWCIATSTIRNLLKVFQKYFIRDF